MTETPVQRLPRGRHGLSRDEVESSQRLRMLVAMADAMMDKGYVGTSVADVIKRAGVSRETFYQQFSSKADCFSATFDAAADAVLGAIAADLRVDLAELGSDGHTDPATRYARFVQAFTAYLEALAAHPAYARLFHALLDRGVALAPGPYEVLFPGLAHDDAVIDQVVAATADAARSVASGPPPIAGS